MDFSRIVRSAAPSLVISLALGASSAGSGPPVLTAQDIRAAHPAVVPLVREDPEDDAGENTTLAFTPNASCDDRGPGKERWFVKTSLPVPATTPAQLANAAGNAYDVSDFMVAKNVGSVGKAFDAVRIPNPVAIASDKRHEGDLVAVTGYIRSIGCENDGDFHVNIAPSRSVTSCAVVEVPNPNKLQNTPSAPFVRQRAAALRIALAQMYAAAGQKHAAYPYVTFAGQLFYDGFHYSPSKGPGGGRGAQLKPGTP